MPPVVRRKSACDWLRSHRTRWVLGENAGLALAVAASLQAHGGGSAGRS